MHKYKIKEEMDKLNVLEYKYAIRELPKLLGIAFNTFCNYRKMTINDSRDIPYINVLKIEQFFGMQKGTLCNVEPNIDSINVQMSRDISGDVIAEIV